MMRSRAGDSVKLADLLDEAVERADVAQSPRRTPTSGPRSGSSWPTWSVSEP